MADMCLSSLAMSVERWKCCVFENIDDGIENLVGASQSKPEKFSHTCSPHPRPLPPLFLVLFLYFFQATLPHACRYRSNSSAAAHPALAMSPPCSPAAAKKGKESRTQLARPLQSLAAVGPRVMLGRRFHFGVGWREHGSGLLQGEAQPFGVAAVSSKVTRQWFRGAEKPAVQRITTVSVCIMEGLNCKSGNRLF